MRKIRLANGTTYEVDRCGAADGRLSIRLVAPGILLNDIFPFFVDPEKTGTIEHYFEGTRVDHKLFIGFTLLRSASLENSGAFLMLEETEPGSSRIEDVDSIPASDDRSE